MSDLKITVQKYGGSSVASPEKIKAVAQFIAANLNDKQHICVVVSAMGHTTNELISLAHKICNDPKKRELDMLISCGERSSMALLAMALNAIGVSAVSLTGSQSGIITDDNHGGAEIIAIKPDRVLEAFKNHQVVIIAGFQGVSEKKEITTLRRGGSDTTAVAMASALRAEVCEIYTDVSGVMDADPRVIPHAQKLPAVTLSQMESMALYGAKVLAHDAIRLANELGVSMRVAKTGEAIVGTHITRAPMTREKWVTAITHLRALVRIVIERKQLASAWNMASYFLCGAMRDSKFIGYISNDISQEFVGKDAELNPGLALMTLHLSKNQFAMAVFQKLSQVFSEKSIPIADLIMGSNEIFVVIADDRLNEGLSLLHEALLDRGERS